MKPIFSPSRLALPLFAMAATLSTHNASAQYYDLLSPTLTDNLLKSLHKRTAPTGDVALRDGAPVLIAAHRGVVDGTHPENSVQAIVNAMNYGIEAIELDVWQSADYVPYLMHDISLKRMTDHQQYSDIYRWTRDNANQVPGQHASDAVKTPDWATLSQYYLCSDLRSMAEHGGHGLTEDNPSNCVHQYKVPSLIDGLNALYLNSYQGLVFLDLRGPENVVDVAVLLTHYALDDRSDFGTWIANHVVLKFQTTMVKGPKDYWSKVIAKYQQNYNEILSNADVALALFVQPVYTSNNVANFEASVDVNWALGDYQSWVSAYTVEGSPDALLPPLVGVKAAGAVLNKDPDDLFTYLWKQGASTGVYVPNAECKVASPSTAASNLTGNQGVWWEGGICGPIVPAMNSNECGNASTTVFDTFAAGCTDHRPFFRYWHDAMKFGFIITDDPVGAIAALAGHPGQRPGGANLLKGVRLLDVTAGYRVAADGSGAYATIGAALDALPATGGVIEIAPGTYDEKLAVTKPNVSLLGTGKDASRVVITHNDSAVKTNPATGQPFGTSRSYTVSVTGKDFYANNLTIRNTADYEAPNYRDNGQAVALYSAGDRAVYRDVMVVGGHDTLYVNGGARAYFKNCYVEGYVDYIFGNGKAVFDGCQIKTKVHGGLGDEATITAHSRASATEDSGFVIANSTLLFDSPYMNNVWLGRPWGQYAATYFVNTKMGPQVADAGWIEFVPGTTTNLPTSVYREYQTRMPGTAGAWEAFDIGLRESVSPHSNVPLTAAEAAALAPDAYLAGADKWQPSKVAGGTLHGQALPIPTPPFGAPGAPVITTVTGGNGNINIAWAGTPANPTETGYTLTATQGGKTYGPVHVPATATSGYIGGLANGTAATITLAEVNPEGTSASVSATATPAAHDPAAPAAITFQPSTTSAVMNFTLPSQGAQPVLGGSVPHAGVYTALYASEMDAYAGKALAGTSTGFTATTYTFTGLASRARYWVSLRAFNGSWSPLAVTSFVTQ